MAPMQPSSAAAPSVRPLSAQHPPSTNLATVPGRPALPPRTGPVHAQMSQPPESKRTSLDAFAQSLGKANSSELRQAPPGPTRPPLPSRPAQYTPTDTSSTHRSISPTGSSASGVAANYQGHGKPAPAYHTLNVHVSSAAGTSTSSTPATAPRVPPPPTSYHPSHPQPRPTQGRVAQPPPSARPTSAPQARPPIPNYRPNDIANANYPVHLTRRPSPASTTPAPTAHPALPQEEHRSSLTKDDLNDFDPLTTSNGSTL